MLVFDMKLQRSFISQPEPKPVATVTCLPVKPKALQLSCPYAPACLHFS
jgi:hypothetical protein